MFKITPSKVKLLSATAAFVVPSEVRTLLLDGLDTVLNPVPLDPAVPDVPASPIGPNPTLTNAKFEVYIEESK